MDVTGMVYGGAFLGLLAAAWGNIKALGWRACCLFVRRCVVRESIGSTVLSGVISRCGASSAGDRTYSSFPSWVHSRSRYESVATEILADSPGVYWHGWWPVLFGRMAAKGQDGKEQGHPGTGDFVFTFLRGTFPLEEIMAASLKKAKDAAVDAHSMESPRHRTCRLPATEGATAGPMNDPWKHLSCYRPLGVERSDLYKPGRRSSLSSLFHPPRVLALIGEIRHWAANRAWYEHRGIPWKRGWLLFGPPGTGKTSLARAFAEELDMPLMLLDLHAMDDAALVKSWDALRLAAPCIALIEDVDNVFRGRENISSGPPGPACKEGEKESVREMMGRRKLSFDCLLNCLDGAEPGEGIFLVVTTNHPDSVDPALARPGRIDRSIELGFMDPPCKEAMARRILDGFPEALERMLRSPEFALDQTPARWQEACAASALACLWAVRENGDEDEDETAETAETAETRNAEGREGREPVEGRAGGPQAVHPLPQEGRPLARGDGRLLPVQQGRAEDGLLAQAQG